MKDSLKTIEGFGDAMACDMETGICGPVGAQGGSAQAGGIETISFVKPARKVDLYYVTDPICSHCWALEPVLRRFVREFGGHLNVRTVLGGLLPEWNGFADRKNGISGPADVAGHWREVGEASRMPIDGTLWHDDPVTSSYPPSRVFLTLREKSPELADQFLRRAREAVFAFNRNISDPAVLAGIVSALDTGAEPLDGDAVVAEADSPLGHERLRRDIELARQLGARGFPTLVFLDEEGNGTRVVGAQPLEAYVQALRQTLGEEARSAPVPTLAELLRAEGLLFAKEIEVFFDVPAEEVEAFVERELPTGQYSTAEVLGERYVEAR